MAQPQSHVPPQAFSPTQHSPSPAGSQPGFSLPPNKRPRTDGPVSQPGSPYAPSPYAVSPVGVGTPPLTAASPPYAQTPTLPNAYATPYTNGHSTPTLNLPDARPATASPLNTPQPASVPLPQYSNATLVPLAHTNSALPNQNVMGPPQKPAAKEFEYDVTDSLAGTGIDLRVEEQYMSDLFSNSLDANSEARTGFAVYPPGPKSTFYGAGPANQPAEVPSDQDQTKFAAQAAERAWAESSMRLAVQRAQELTDPFLLVALLHQRVEKIAREHHIDLNLEMKNSTQATGRPKGSDQFPTPVVTVNMVPGPDSTMVQTTGSFIPQEALLVDQIALLSIATKQRLRECIEDANLVAQTRQTTSHGEIPAEWAVAAGPMNSEPLSDLAGNAAQHASDGGVTDEHSLKRSLEALGDASNAVPAKLPKIASFMTLTMRESAKREREWEEARLKKRQQRRDGTTDSTSSVSRSGSIAPGTPGSVAPDSEKSLSKKEQKKTQLAKAAEASNHANQNITSNMFAGLGGRASLFGKKKTKTYDWMNRGSGTSTPTKAAPGGARGTPGPATAGAASMALTTEGRNRLGTWRENKEKGKNIQLRDWVTVLERDGRETKALQQAYIQLDASDPK